METQDLVLGSKDLAHIIKGKRTKRQRTVSPLRLAVTSSSSCAGESGGERTCTSNIDFSDSSNIGGEEEDMANCLILLARGSQKMSPPSGLSSHGDEKCQRLSEPPAAKMASGSDVYRCKTCNRSFPSFQALGGHRASHKKPNSKEYDNDHRLVSNTSTALSLQISSRSNSIKSNKVHECSICGAEFSSGQALGGHMRRHRAVFSSSFTTSTPGMSLVGGSSPSQSQEYSKKPRNSLQLDLNLPAPEDDARESKLRFPSKKQVIAFSSSSSLVDCHY